MRGRPGILLAAAWLLALPGCEVAQVSRSSDDGAPATVSAPSPRAGTQGEGSAARPAQPEEGVPAAVALREEARQLLQEGDTDRAAAHLERAIRIDPAAAAGYFELARVRVLEGLHGEARQLLLQARALLDGQGIREGRLFSAIEELLVAIAGLQRR